MIGQGQYGVQICSIFLLLLLMYLCIRRRSLGLQSTRVFFYALVVSLITIGLDYGTTWGIHHYEDVNPLLGLIVFKSYLMGLSWVSFFGFYYAVNSMISGNDIRKRLGRIGLITESTGSLLIWILHLELNPGAEGYFFSGPSVIATYVTAMIFIIWTQVFAVSHRKQLTKRSFLAIQVWLIIWIVATVLQSLHMQTPITGFCIALGYTIIFAELENPEGYIDRDTGVFNAHALIGAINQRYMRGEVFALIDVIILIRDRDYDRETKKSLLTILGSRLDMIRGAQVFRSVGDEFVILFEDEEAMEVAREKVRDAMERPVNTLPAGLDFGVFYLLFPDCSLAGSAEEIFRYHSFFRPEDTDRDYTIVDEDSINRIRHNLDIRDLITKAISQNMVEIYYQPIYSVMEERFTSAEALARIRTEDGDIVMPSEFIPIAEESGLILELGRVVFEKVCSFIHDKDIVGMGLSYIEINLSMAQCEEKTLAADFQRIMKEHGVDPRRVNLEITESGSLSSRKVLIDNMNTLIRSGVHFSLDDFGTGHSNLDYVMNMPVQIVKFDRSLTRAYFENERTQFVFGAVTRMVRDMGLQIVCEGVETREQYEELYDLGIEFIQGFYFSRPLPEKEFLYFISQRNREA